MIERGLLKTHPEITTDLQRSVFIKTHYLGFVRLVRDLQVYQSTTCSCSYTQLGFTKSSQDSIECSLELRKTYQVSDGYESIFFNYFHLFLPIFSKNHIFNTFLPKEQGLEILIGACNVILFPGGRFYLHLGTSTLRQLTLGDGYNGP